MCHPNNKPLIREDDGQDGAAPYCHCRERAAAANRDRVASKVLGPTASPRRCRLW
jgi:hypothetical protein